jgi:iron complex outermembrane recepter protein
MIIRSRSKALAFGIVAITVALMSGVASAGDDSGDDLSAIVVTAPHYVPTTDTSATKIAIPLIETPQAVSVITRDQIDMLNFQNLQQAVRYTAGVIGENYGPDERVDWLTLRGFQPVEYIDGLQAPVGSVPNVGIDLWGAESVEILKGPSGVLYGQTPPGGLVNLTMRRPQADYHGELQAQFGSYADKQVAGDVTGSLLGDGVLEGRLTALWRDRDTQTDFVRSKRTYIAPALTWNIDHETQLTFLSYYQHDKITGDGGGFLPAVGTILPNPNGTIPINFDAGEPGYNRFTREQFGAGYEFSHVFNEHVSVHQNFKYSRSNNHTFSIYGAGLQADDSTLNRDNFIYPEDIKQLAVDSRVEIRGDTGAVEHVALVGVDYRDLKNHTGFIFGAGPTLDVFNPVYGAPIPAPYYVAPDYISQDQKQFGTYAQDEMKIQRFRVTLSVREDWLKTANAGVSPISDKAFTYRAGVNYLLDSGLAPYVSYSTSFLPQSGATFSGTPFVPSTGEQVEAGVKFEPTLMSKDVKLFTSAAIYELTQKNVVTPDPDHEFFSVQTGEVQVKGVEIEGIARIRERLSINGSYSFTNSEVVRSNDVDLGKELPIVPRNKASLFSDYTWQTGMLAGFGVGVGVRYLGPSFGDSANTLESSPETLVDAIAHYDTQGWKIAVNATNLADKIYIQRCSDLTQCFYGSRRTVFVTLGKKW